MHFTQQTSKVFDFYLFNFYNIENGILDYRFFNDNYLFSRSLLPLWRNIFISGTPCISSSGKDSIFDNFLTIIIFILKNPVYNIQECTASALYIFNFSVEKINIAVYNLDCSQTARSCKHLWVQSKLQHAANLQGLLNSINTALIYFSFKFHKYFISPYFI